MATTEADGVPPQPIADNLCGAEPHSFLSLLGSGGSAPHIFGRHIHVRLHELRGHEFDRVSQRGKFSGPIMGTGAGFHADETRLPIGEERQHVMTLDLFFESRLAMRIDAMDCENRFC